VAAFLAALLPILPGELRYHGDERFYTDGALHMLASGDYLTPAYADGRPRFLKPGLSYWLIAASFKTLGVGLASSRGPSLLAGAGILWLTGRTVLALGGTESASFLATAILASNMSLLLAAVRATPDALLCLFLSASAFGFLRLIVSGERGRGVYALAYLGAGLAVAVKGLLGLLPVLFSFLFCALGRRRGAPTPRDLVRWPLMAAGAAVGLFWFGAVLLEHGATAWSGFFADQIGDKVEASRLRALANVPRYLLAALQHFLPWSALAALAWFVGRREAPAADRQGRLLLLYAVGFVALMVAIFAAGRDLRPRYLLPAYPLIAVVLVPWLERRLSQSANRAALRLLQATIVVAGIGGGVAVAAVGWALDPRLLAAGLALTVAAAIAIAATRHGWRPAVVGTAMLVICALPLNDLLVSPVFDEQPAGLAAARIAALKGAPASVGIIGMGSEFGGQLSLHLRGRIPVTAFGPLPPAGSAALPPVLLVTEPYRAELLARGYRLEACGFLQPRWTGRDLWRALAQDDAAIALRQRRIPVHLALSGHFDDF
jgi:4-amino-4-deoxy-L-arabinose transferase-like glycosyltransferase